MTTEKQSWEERLLNLSLNLSLDDQVVKKVPWCKASDFEQLKSFIISLLHEKAEEVRGMERGEDEYNRLCWNAALTAAAEIITKEI